MFQSRPAPAAPAPLCQFKAGMLQATPAPTAEDPLRFKIDPDLRRGLVLLQRGSDGATHFVWKDRATQRPVEDLLVFPGDQELAKVDTGRAGDRVVVLTFKTSPGKRMFFWMQEPVGGSKDDDRLREINRLMNPAAAAAAGSTARGAASSAAPVAPAESAVGFDELTAILSDLGYSDEPPANTASAAKSQEEDATKKKTEGEE
ncbi:hypothetical protein BASA81_000745 [Batrachochytrium salamandrivorans]|nr:hypothetical protein BASA81_000745 [Batrachochytrium salamandrivorans]